MNKLLRNLFAAVAAMSVAITTFAIPAAAALDSEPFEFERPSGAYSGPYTLTYVGVGGGTCDTDDRRFRVNVYSSSVRQDWKIVYKYYNNPIPNLYSKTPSGRTIYGYKLGQPDQAHICIGRKEFTWPFVASPWTTQGVVDNLVVWRR